MLNSCIVLTFILRMWRLYFFIAFYFNNYYIIIDF